MLHFVYIFSTNIITEYFKHTAHSPFSPQNDDYIKMVNFFESCIIPILHTDVL
jgi:hypothetical protein